MKMFQFLILSTLLCPVLRAMEGGVIIRQINNKSLDDAYLIVPGIERESVERSARGEILGVKPSLLQSVREVTLPIHKVQEAYVLHSNTDITDAVKLNISPDEPFYVATKNGPLVKFMGKTIIPLIEISKEGKVE